MENTSEHGDAFSAARAAAAAAAAAFHLFCSMKLVRQESKMN